MLPVPAAIDRALARSADRIEILSPHRPDARDEAAHADRRRDDWSLAWRDAQADRRAGAGGGVYPHRASLRFAAQRLAQEGFGPGAHLENWRGAARAYVRAQSLATPGSAGISILV